MRGRCGNFRSDCSPYNLRGSDGWCDGHRPPRAERIAAIRERLDHTLVAGGDDYLRELLLGMLALIEEKR